MIDSKLPDATLEQEKTEIIAKILPNPARGNAHLFIDSSIDDQANISILSLDGKELISNNHNVFSGKQFISIDVSGLNSGIYYVVLKSKYINGVQKMIIQN